MPPSTVRWIASVLAAAAGVLLMFEAVQFRSYRVELSGLPDRCRRVRVDEIWLGVWRLGRPVVRVGVVA
jgi:hypothetical protein